MRDHIPEVPDTDAACSDTNYALHASLPESSVHVSQHFLKNVTFSMKFQSVHSMGNMIHGKESNIDYCSF